MKAQPRIWAFFIVSYFISKKKNCEFRWPEMTSMKVTDQNIYPDPQQWSIVTPFRVNGARLTRIRGIVFFPLPYNGEFTKLT